MDPAVAAAVGSGGVPSGAVGVTGAAPLVGPSQQPEVVYVAEEGCSLCAAQRWSLLIALSRFGTLRDVLLAQVPTAAGTGAVDTFSFRKLSYRSDVLGLVTLEMRDASGTALTPARVCDSPAVAGLARELPGH